MKAKAALAQSHMCRRLRITDRSSRPSWRLGGSSSTHPPADEKDGDPESSHPASENDLVQEELNGESYILLEQNQLNIHNNEHEQPEEEATRLDLAELLEVLPGSASNKAVDGIRCSACNDPNSEQQNQKHSDLCLIQTSVHQHFPEPPEDLEQNLPQHLDNVQNTLVTEFKRLVLQLDEVLMGQVIDRYHRQTFTHLDGLLQNISSSKNHFLLMQWVLRTYLSHKLLAHPDLQRIDPCTNIDLLLWTEWEAKARDKLLDSVRKEVRGSLENILQTERTSDCCDSEEHYIRVFVDTIQCIKAKHLTAQQISLKLSDYIQEVCFQELLTFVKRYMTEQSEALRKQPETIHFLKTLTTCRELRQHAQTDGAATSSSVDIVQTLDDMEAFTLKLLMDVVTSFSETHLKVYFKSNCKSFSLFATVRKHFPKLCYTERDLKSVMDAVYGLIIQLYVKHLIKTNMSKLERFWSPSVSKTVSEDAQLLHETISKLAPGVQQQNLILTRISEMLDCGCIVALKVTAATMKHECALVRENPELLPALLKWKGLSKGHVREVMDAIN